MPGDARWADALRRLDRLRAGPAVAAGLLLGGLVGVYVAVSAHPAALAGFAVALLVATALALTAEPVADETSRKVSREPAAGEERVNPTDGSVLVYVPGGEFTLGADDLEEPSKPVHEVRLTGFWIGKYPVTREQYRLFLAANPEQPEPRYWKEERFGDDRQPVVGVRWDETRAYCEWAGLQLPSEAQWEAAARGSDQRRYPWGDQEPNDELADFGQDYQSGSPKPAGSHPLGAGPYGTLDQAGGVWEWCVDVWDPQAYEKRSGEPDPVSTEGEEGVRVLRGGAWYFPAGNLAAAFRFRDRSSSRFLYFGFRCVLPVPAEQASEWLKPLAEL